MLPFRVELETLSLEEMDVYDRSKTRVCSCERSARQKVHAMTGTCFVVMGFGKKTDFESGRTLDLNLTYNYIIKPAVIAAGLECIRADEIKHTGPIDVPMYEQLLHADVVVADLSTANTNAYYELGVRHALRPYTTVIICEDGWSPPPKEPAAKPFPFDVNHVVVRQYRHMGEGIDYAEVERFRKVLTEVIHAIVDQPPRRPDSPVYTFLDRLSPPVLAEPNHGLAETAPRSASAVEEKPDGGPEPENTKLYSELMEEVENAKRAGNFEEAKSLLKLIRRKVKSDTPGTAGAPTPPEGPYIILALVTYKAKQDTPEKEIAALREACDLLYSLNPATSNDTETLGLWGAVHKRLWDMAKDTVALDKAIRSYQRGSICATIITMVLILPTCSTSGLRILSVSRKLASAR